MERNGKIKSNHSWQGWIRTYGIIIIIFIGFFQVLFSYGALSYEEGEKIDYFFLDAIRSRQKNEYDRSLNDLIYCLQIDSTSSAVWYELAACYRLLHKEDQALNAFKKAVCYTPDNLEYKKALANLNREIGNDNAAITLYEELIEKDPQNMELYYCLSLLYIRKNHLGKAIETLNRIERNIGVNEAVSLKKCQLYQLLGKTKEALTEMEFLSEKFPTETKYQLLIGDFYLKKGETEKALSYYQKALITDPYNPDCTEALLNYYKVQGDQEATIEEIEKAVRNSSLEMEIKLKILGDYIENIRASDKKFDLTNKDRINQLFDILIQQYSKSKDLNRIYGQFLLMQNRKEEAKMQFQMVTETMPNDPYAWIKLLSIAVQEKNSDETIMICEKALSHISDIPELYFYQGIAYSMKKSYWKALDSYQKGFQVIPKEDSLSLSSFSGQIGDIYYQLGNKKEAFRFYEQAIQYNPQNDLVLNNYAYCLALNKKNLDKAEKMAAEAVLTNPENIEYLDTYAWIFFQKKNYSLAKFYIECVISKNNTPDGRLLEHYGDILFKLGNKKEALSEWKKSLSLKEVDQEKTSLLQRKIINQTYYDKE